LLADAAGRPVTGSGGWHHRRREIVALFDSQVYGRVPANAPTIRWDFTAQETVQVGGMAIVTRHYLGHAAVSTLSSPPLAIDLRIDMPENVHGRVPVILEFGFPEGFHFPGPPDCNRRGPTAASRCSAAAGASPCLCRGRSSPTTGRAFAKA
jgi:hypothetical protein